MAPASLRPARAAAALAIAAAIAAGPACGSGVGDPICTESSVPADKSDDCPYGPPGGPRVAGGDCPAVVLETDLSKCTATWEADVFPILADPAKANCSASGCHGAKPGAKGVYLNAADPEGAYLELKGYFNDKQQPYLSDDDPTRTWMLCSLEGTAGGGSPMPPPSGIDAASLAIVREWVACGMLPVGTGGEGGGGGGSP